MDTRVKESKLDPVTLEVVRNALPSEPVILLILMAVAAIAAPHPDWSGGANISPPSDPAKL